MTPRRKRLWAMLICAVAVACLADQARCQPDLGIRDISIHPHESQAWLQHVMPLPKQVAWEGRAVLGPEDLAVRVAAPRDLLVRQALEELREGLNLAELSSSRERYFRLTLQVGGPEAERLQGLANKDEAYTIVPAEDNRGLLLAALTTRGLYYATKTLVQLARARSIPGQVVIPLVQVTDWPDLAGRGLWGSDSFLHLRWLGDCRLNLVEQIAAVWVDEEGRGHGQLKPGREPMVEEGPRYGIQPLPAVVHLNQLEGKGVFEAYPELRAQGGDEGAVCFSQPSVVKVLADWLIALGSLPHVTEVSVWMSENLHGRGGCRCDRCRQMDRNLSEARAILAAWRQAREKLPELGLRLLTSEETYGSNELILREVQGIPEVQVSYYHSLLTYTASHGPMIEEPLVRWVRQGGRLGVYPQINGTVGPAVPFTGAAFVRQRMNEFVDKGLSYVLGYATPTVRHVQFNVEALAEWSWNARGRSPRDFAVSYAVRHGIPHQEEFAQWAETIGAVAWDLYASDWPAGEARRALMPVAKALRKGKLPRLGEKPHAVSAKPWGEIGSAAQLEDDLAAARRAVDLARQVGVTEILHESLVIEGFMQSLHALWRLKPLVRPEGVAEADRAEAARQFTRFLRGCERADKALVEWSRAFAPDLEPIEAERYWQVWEILRRTAADMRALAAELGLRIETQGG